MAENISLTCAAGLRRVGRLKFLVAANSSASSCRRGMYMVELSLYAAPWIEPRRVGRTERRDVNGLSRVDSG